MKELFENGDMSVDKIPDFCKGYLVEGKPAREYFNHLQLLSAKAKQRKASRLQLACERNQRNYIMKIMTGFTCTAQETPCF